MHFIHHVGRRIVFLACALAAPFSLDSAASSHPTFDSVDSRSIEQFLARTDRVPSYRASRRLEARGAGKSGWLEVSTDFAPADGFRYAIVAEGGSDYIRNRVLRAVLEAEQKLIARNETHRSALDPSNYRFESAGRDTAGLVQVRLFPRRNDGVLLVGSMFLQENDGDLVRLEGRMARSPSFWVTKVDVVRSYERIGGALLPIALESTANVRLLGHSSFHMTYNYETVDGRRVADTSANSKKR